MFSRLVTQQEHVVVGRSGSSRSSLANMMHTKTLFVINFEPIDTRMRLGEAL